MFSPVGWLCLLLLAKLRWWSLPVTDTQKILKKIKLWRDWACLLTLLLVALAIGAFLLPPLPYHHRLTYRLS